MRGNAVSAFYFPTLKTRKRRFAGNTYTVSFELVSSCPKSFLEITKEVNASSHPGGGTRCVHAINITSPFRACHILILSCSQPSNKQTAERGHHLQYLRLTRNLERKVSSVPSNRKLSPICGTESVRDASLASVARVSKPRVNTLFSPKRSLLPVSQHNCVVCHLQKSKQQSMDTTYKSIVSSRLPSGISNLYTNQRRLLKSRAEQQRTLRG